MRGLTRAFRRALGPLPAAICFQSHKGRPRRSHLARTAFASPRRVRTRRMGLASAFLAKVKLLARHARFHIRSLPINLAFRAIGGRQAWARQFLA